MTLTGNIEQVFDETTIMGKDDKSLRKKEFLLTIETGQFPKSICIEIWNSKLYENVLVGNQVSVECSIQSRKVGERYFNNIKASKIDLTE